MNSEYAPLTAQLEDTNFSGYLKGVAIDEQARRNEALQIAVQFAVAPVSGFKVGALAFGSSGKCFLGANMEFSGAPLSACLHAEQSAVLNAWMHGEPSIEVLVVSASPCGHCRQFLQELPNAKTLKCLLPTGTSTLEQLLPSSFSLSAKGNLFADHEQSCYSIRSVADDLQQRAVNAASRSYTPYSGAAEGFIIKGIDGRYFSGRAAESAALNPSVPAVLSAFNQRNLSSGRKAAIDRCIHARMPTSVNNASSLGEAILRSISSVQIETVLIETG